MQIYINFKINTTNYGSIDINDINEDGKHVAAIGVCEKFNTAYDFPDY